MSQTAKKMGFQLEEALGVEILQESYSATIDVGNSETKQQLVKHVKEEPSMSLVHEEDTIYTLKHDWH